jgi:quinol monooxygenase YgiN
MAAVMLHRQSMIRLALKLVAARGNVGSMAAVLRWLMAQAQSERGCVSCQLSADLADPDTLHYIEEWATESALRDQIRSARFQSLIALMETANEPLLTVQMVAWSSGLRYIEEALRASASDPRALASRRFGGRRAARHRWSEHFRP